MGSICVYLDSETELKAKKLRLEKRLSEVCAKAINDEFDFSDNLETLEKENEQDKLEIEKRKTTLQFREKRIAELKEKQENQKKLKEKQEQFDELVNNPTQKMFLKVMDYLERCSRNILTKDEMVKLANEFVESGKIYSKLYEWLQTKGFYLEDYNLKRKELKQEVKVR